MTVGRKLAQNHIGLDTNLVTEGRKLAQNHTSLDTNLDVEVSEQHSVGTQAIIKKQEDTGIYGHKQCLYTRNCLHLNKNLNKKPMVTLAYID